MKIEFWVLNNQLKIQFLLSLSDNNSDIYINIYIYNWDSLHARLKQPLKGVELQEKEHKKIKGHMKSV